METSGIISTSCSEAISSSSGGVTEVRRDCGRDIVVELQRVTALNRSRGCAHHVGRRVMVPIKFNRSSSSQLQGCSFPHARHSHKTGLLLWTSRSPHRQHF